MSQESHATNNLADAVVGLTNQLIQWQRQDPLVTKADLAATEARLLLALGSGPKPPPHPGKSKAHFNLVFSLPTNKEPQNIMVTKTITNEQQIVVTLKPVTDTGKPAKLDGSPAWTVTSGTSQVVVADDGLSATLISSDDAGDTEIVLKADADTGAGVEEITETIVLTVTSATAKNFGISFGEPTPKPAPPTA